MDAKSGYFLFGDITRLSPVHYREVFKMATSFPASLSYPSMLIARCTFCSLNNACTVANIPRGVLGTRVNLDM